MSAINVIISAITSNATSALEKLKGAATEFGSGLAGGLNPALTAFKLGEKAAEQLSKAFMDLVKDSRKLINESRKFNMPIKELQEMKAACDEVGVAAGAVVRTIKGLTKTLLLDKTSAKSRMLHQMGISDEDIQKMEANKDFAIKKLREVYNTLDEGGKEKFGLDIIGAGFQQFKPVLENSAVAMEDASARTHISSMENVQAFAALANTMDDFKEQAKDLVGFLGPYVGIIAELLSVIFAGAIYILVEAFIGVKAVILAVYSVFALIYMGVLKLAQGFVYLGNVMGIVSDEKAQEYGKGLQTMVDDASNHIEKQWDKTVKQNENNNEKMAKSATKTWHNLEKDVNAIAVDTGVMNENERALGLKRDYDAAQQKLKKIEEEEKAAQGLQKTMARMGLLNVDQANAMNKKIADDKKKTLEEMKDLENTYGNLYGTNIQTGTAKPPDVKKDDKQFKEEFKEKMSTRDSAEGEMKTKEKMLAVEQDVKNLKLEQAELEKDSVANVEKIKVVKDELMKKEKEYGKLVLKNAEEERKEAERIAKAKDKLERTQAKNKEKWQEILEKDKIERMKKEGHSQQEIDQEILKQKMAKTMREGQELQRLRAVAAKDATEANVEAVEHQKAALAGAYSDANDAMRTLMYSGGGSTVSNAAKKGMGGGISSNPVAKLTDINSKQLETLNRIKDYIEKSLDQPPMPLAPK